MTVKLTDIYISTSLPQQDESSVQPVKLLRNKERSSGPNRGLKIVWSEDKLNPIVLEDRYDHAMNEIFKS